LKQIWVSTSISYSKLISVSYRVPAGYRMKAAQGHFGPKTKQKAVGEKMPK
jgi:hypothetical protein